MSHHIVTFEGDPTWHLLHADDPTAEIECGAGEGKALVVVAPIPDMPSYEPGLAVLLAVVTDEAVCNDCCTMILARTGLETDDGLWAEFEHYDHTHGC